MAKNNNLTDFLTSLANKFRDKLGTSNPINPQDFEDKVDEVYAKGQESGGTSDIRTITETAKNLSISEICEYNIDKITIFGEEDGVVNPALRIESKNLLTNEGFGESTSNIRKYGVYEAKTEVGASVIYTIGSQVLPAGTYTFSYRNIRNSKFLAVFLQYTDSQGVVHKDWFNGTTITVTEPITLTAIIASKSAHIGKGQKWYWSAQVEKGSERTDQDNYSRPQEVIIPYTLTADDSITIFNNSVVVKINGVETDITDTTEGQALLAMLSTYNRTLNIFCDVNIQIEYNKGIDNYNFALGKQEELVNYWRIMQHYGNRTIYTYFHYKDFITDDLFKPIYPIQGNLSYAFQGTENLNFIDIPLKITKESGTNAFAGSQIVSIKDISFADDVTISNLFDNATFLMHLNVTCPIKINGFNISKCGYLLHDSLISILNQLEDKSTDTSGTSWVCTLGATNLAKLTDEEKLIATQKGWTLA